MIYSNILETIGNTPIVKLSSFENELKCEIYGKCEFLNAGGSVKDRIGIRMIENAEKKGANAIISVSFTTSMISQGAAELMAFGTAVLTEDE